MSEAIEKFLQDSGVSDELESQLRQNEQVQQTETPTPDPAQEQTQDIWSEVIQPETPKEKDWKKEYESLNDQHSGLLSKIEKNNILKRLHEVVDSPEFDASKFFESHVPKRTDFTKLSLEQLYKEKLGRDKTADYTPSQINKLWDKKKAEFESDDPDETTALEKNLRSQLINEFVSSEPKEVEEPEIISQWKQSAKQQQEEMERYQNEQIQLGKNLTDFAQSLVGKKIAGSFEITKEYADAVSVKMDSNTYIKDGKLDHQKLVIDRLKAAMFDDVINYYKKEAVIEARNQITRPRKEVGSQNIVQTDDRDDETKVLQEYAAAMGLPKGTSLGKVKI